MNKTKRLLPLLLPVLALLATGCAMPLPAAQLTATAESGAPTPAPTRSGGEVRSESSGAPNSASLSLQQTVNDDEPPSALAALEDDELAGVEDDETEAATPAAVEAEATATATPEAESTPQPAANASDGSAASSAAPAAYADELLSLLNQYRQEQGLPALQADASLSASAMAYAQYMATSGFFGHYPPSGSTPAGRIAAAGFTGQYEGEALSAGQPTPAVALSRLLGSPRHAAILLSGNSVAAGVGYYYEPGSYYGSYWVVVTGNP